jgi:hypothetical protein
MGFEGGAKLQIELKARARKWGSYAVDAGLFEPDVASYGYINEFGAPRHNIPPRPFMRTTFAFRNAEWKNVLAAELKNGASSKEALKVAGAYMAQNICETLRNAPMLFEGNAQKTIDKKGFNYALLETGKMFKAVRYNVRALK